MLLRNLPAQKRHIFVSIFDTDNNWLPKHTKNQTSVVCEDTRNKLCQNHDQNQWNDSWLLVTQTLNLPKFLESNELLEPVEEEVDSRFSNALQILLRPVLFNTPTTENRDFITWFSSQVRQHYLNQVLPILLQVRDKNTLEHNFFNSIEILRAARRQYECKFSLIKEQIEILSPGSSKLIVDKFQRNLDVIISNTYFETISIPLTKVLNGYVTQILGLHPHNSSPNFSAQKECLIAESAEKLLLKIVSNLKHVGLASEGFQIIFAEIMNNAMLCFIHDVCKDTLSFRLTVDAQDSSGTTISSEINQLEYQTVTTHPSRCMKYIFNWIESKYAKLAFQVLSSVNNKAIFSWPEKQKFREIAISHLVEFRTNQLFDIVENWPHKGEALDDFRTTITTPERRLHLTEVFSQTLTRSILHPAASTRRILQIYISMIRSFHSLDNSKVLLDKVAYPLQLYLYTREDTVRIIISSLLADTDDAYSGNMGEKLTELAWLLNNEAESIDYKNTDIDLDWHDMDWVPDPVDAGPSYKRSKNIDIIGTLISVLGSRESFIKEFQGEIAENFLKSDGTFSKEIKVLELLKAQFGEAPLQSCEVMLKDIQDSRDIDSFIQRKHNLNTKRERIQGAFENKQRIDGIETESFSKLSLHAKILSRLFWPRLNTETYRVPPEILKLQGKYEEDFISLKPLRRLTWLNTSGQASIKIELEDRTLVEETFTWQAAVILAFQSYEEDSQPQQRTIKQLIEYLQMEESFVRSALKFWVKKFVLYEISHDTYAVLEILNSQDRVCLDTHTRESGSTNSNDEITSETNRETHNNTMNKNIEIYWQFIQGMLTNSSRQMSLQQIGMMLKTLVVDGFPYSNEELKEFLKQKITEGVLEMIGGKFQLKKQH